MTGRRILGVVVTYNPAPTLSDHLAALRGQCEALLVIDNGSSNLAAIAEMAAKHGAGLIDNGANLGIAAALSQAARAAQEGAFDWLATFDQDSHCPAGALEALLQVQQRHPQRDRIGIVALSHRDRATGRDYHHPFDILETAADWRILRTTITSGCLVRVAVFREVGLFDDKLFIDAVDHDFCLRVRKAGGLIVQGRHQMVDHSIGEATEHRLLGLRIVCTHHSVQRRYYMTRNQIEVCMRNLWFDPVWAGKGMLQFLKGSIAALLYEEDRLAKLGAMLQGTMHFCLRRFGPRA